MNREHGPLTLALPPQTGGEGILAMGFEGPARPEEDSVSVGTRGVRGEREGPECTNREGPVPPASATQWVAICRLTDIVPNTGVCALVGGRQVAVFRLDDDGVYALDNHDPFSRANVISRGIVGDLKGELVVASPVYKQHFSLASGQCLEEPQVRLAVYRVRLEDGMVWVES
jgi:nitrite reductase (NADH) small subunit